MVLIDNKNVALINFSGVILGPRVNKVSDEDYERIKKTHARQIKGMVASGEIEIITKGKITLDLIQNTLDKELLEEWEVKASGEHKKAIQAQLELLKIPESEED